MDTTFQSLDISIVIVVASGLEHLAFFFVIEVLLIGDLLEEITTKMHVFLALRISLASIQDIQNEP